MSKTSPIDQIGWTIKFLEAAHGSLEQYSVEGFRKIWWFNPINLTSMRLTKIGVNFAIEKAKIYYYKHKINSRIMPKTLLQLERILEYPYFVQDLETILIFDERTSLVLTLYNDNLQSYLNNEQELN